MRFYLSHGSVRGAEGEKKTPELASRFGPNPTIITQWKRALLTGASAIFEFGGGNVPLICKDQVRDLSPMLENSTAEG